MKTEKEQKQHKKNEEERQLELSKALKSNLLRRKARSANKDKTVTR